MRNLLFAILIIATGAALVWFIAGLPIEPGMQFLSEVGR